jgi:hypothetical protein
MLRCLHGCWTWRSRQRNLSSRTALLICVTQLLLPAAGLTPFLQNQGVRVVLRFKLLGVSGVHVMHVWPVCRVPARISACLPEPQTPRHVQCCAQHVQSRAYELCQPRQRITHHACVCVCVCVCACVRLCCRWICVCKQQLSGQRQLQDCCPHLFARHCRQWSHSCRCDVGAAAAELDWIGLNSELFAIAQLRGCAACGHPPPPIGWVHLWMVACDMCGWQLTAP